MYNHYVFFFNDPPPTEIYTLSLHDALPSTRTAKVRVSVANRAGRLKPEMFAAVELSVADAQRALMVPTAAIYTEAGRSYVYVEVGERRFARRAVEIANGEGPTRRVISG